MTSIAEDKKPEQLTTDTKKSHIARGFGVAQKKNAVEVSQENVKKYENFRRNVYTDVFGGSLRTFWSNVVKHMDESAKGMDAYSIFFKSFILQERQAIKAMKQSLVALKKTASKDPTSALQCIQSEFITFHTSAMEHKKKLVDEVEKEILNKNLKLLVNAHKKSTDAAKSKAMALEKKVDVSHQEATKQFKSFNHTHETILATPVGDPSTNADLWMEEAKYCAAAKKFVTECAAYRKTMSDMYTSYQQSETERLHNLRLLLQKYARSYKGNFIAVANSQELSVLTAALDALDSEKETVMQLKKAQANEGGTKNIKNGEKKRSNSVGSASKVTEDIAMNIPKPFSSKLVVTQSVLSIKAGLFQNWKKMHGLATCDSHLYVFESLAGEGGVDKVANMCPAFTFAIDRSIIQNVDSTRLTFEIVEKTKGFLGIVSQQKQLFKVESKNDLDSWQQVFPK
eukprot:g6413.t1